MDGVSQTTKLYKQLHEQFKNLNSDAQRLSQQKGLAQNLFGPRGPGGRPLTDADMARGGFIQGFAGSMGLPLQRGPGMMRQAAGQAVGGMARGFGGAPFGGVSGVAQGLSGIPIVGGALAGQFTNAMQFGEGALGVQRSRLGMAPFLGVQETGTGIESARARGRASVRPPEKEYSGDEIRKAERDAINREALIQNDPKEQLKEASITTGKILLGGAKDVGRLILRSFTGLGEDISLREPSAITEFRKSRENMSKIRGERITEAGRKAREEAEAPTKQYMAEQQAAGEAAARAERAAPFQDIKAAGLRYGGMSEAESLQAAQGLLQVGGGGMRGLNQSGMLETAFAAQTKFGIGADVSGAYLGAGRTGRGGLVGANEGNAPEKMTRAIQDGLRLGLEGSELQDYMAQMAQGIQAWKTTGVPINQNSIGRLGLAITNTTALGGLRGAAIGRGLAGAGQAVAETGVQDPIDLMMLQTMGGFKGGSLEDYEKAQVQLEEMGGPKGWGKDTMREMVTKLTAAGGGGASGRQVLRKAFGRKGIKMSQAETIALEKGATQGIEGLSAKERERFDTILGERKTIAEGMPFDAEELQAQAEELMRGYGSAVKRSAGIQNKQNAVGEKMLDTLQNLQESQAEITTAFTNLTRGGLEKISGVMNDFAKTAEKMTSSAAVVEEAFRLIATASQTF